MTSKAPHLRVIDTEFLEFVRSLPCIVCTRKPVHPHHVTSVGAGGGDIAENVMPLCAEHHSEWHQAGPGFMAKNYPSVYHWLRLADRHDVFYRIEKSGHIDWEKHYGVG